MRRRRVIVAVVVLVVAGGCFAAYRRVVPVAQPVLAIANTAVSVPGQPHVSWSPYGEQSISLAGRSLSASYGPKTPLPLASIAKIMTALAVLHQRPLALGQQGPVMTMSAEDVAVYQQELAQNESVVKVAAGERLSEYQALQAMLIPSATNVADTTAVWAFGSINSYVNFANQFARQLGLVHTHFANDASGFSPDNVSTPQDLVKLGLATLRNPVIAQIIGQSSAILPVAGTVQNFDIDLGNSGIIGIKTGNTDQAGGAFLFAAKYQSQIIVGAIMGAPDLGTALHDAPEVLGSFESNLQINQPIKAGQILARYKLPWGGMVNAVAQKSLTVVGWQGSKPAVQLSLASLKIPVTAGTQIGTVIVSYQGASQQTPIILQNPASNPSPWWRIFHL